MNVPVGSYMHEHAEVTVDLNEGDDPRYAFELAKATARKALGVDVTPDQVNAAKDVLRRARRASGNDAKSVKPVDYDNGPPTTAW